LLSNDGGVSLTLDGGNVPESRGQPANRSVFTTSSPTRGRRTNLRREADNSTIAIASRSDDGSLACGLVRRWPVKPATSRVPPDPFIVYAGDYRVTLTRTIATRARRKAYRFSRTLRRARAACLDHRFQWTAPLLISPHDPGRFTMLANALQDTAWHALEAISDDLTRNDKRKQQISGGPINKDDTGTDTTTPFSRRRIGHCQRLKSAAR